MCWCTVLHVDATDCGPSYILLYTATVWYNMIHYTILTIISSKILWHTILKNVIIIYTHTSVCICIYIYTCVNIYIYIYMYVLRVGHRSVRWLPASRALFIQKPSRKPSFLHSLQTVRSRPWLLLAARSRERLCLLCCLCFAARSHERLCLFCCLCVCCALARRLVFVLLSLFLLRARMKVCVCFVVVVVVVAACSHERLCLICCLWSFHFWMFLCVWCMFAVCVHALHIFRSCLVIQDWSSSCLDAEI